MTQEAQPITEGGPGSGHHGHKGVLGKHGGSAPGAGGWKASMTPAEAAQWTAGTALDGKTFYHYTSTAAEQGIRQEGIRPMTGFYGDGVYLTDSKEPGSANFIMAPERRLSLAVKVEAPVRGRRELDALYKKFDPDWNLEPAQLLGVAGKDAHILPRSDGSTWLILPSAQQATVIGSTEGLSEQSVAEEVPSQEEVPSSYIWIGSLHRYRDLTTGRFVSESVVLEWVEVSMAQSSVVTDALTQQLASRQIRLQAWQTLMRQEIKDEYIRQYLLGKGGITQMTQADWGSIGGMLSEQYGYLDGFAAQIASGNLSEGGPGSGHHGHKGIPGKHGGSAPGSGGLSSAALSALGKVNKLVLTGGPSGIERFTAAEREFLAQTVTKKEYKLYRGVGLIKARVAQKDRAELNALKPGDEVPPSLMKVWNPYASYSTKVGVARYYASGKLSIVIEAKVPAKSVIVDTAGLEKLLAGTKQTIFSKSDFEYFKSDREVIVREPIAATIRNVKGRL
jgi:hypothetical protein